MEYRKEIKVFEVRGNISLPLRENPSSFSNTSIGKLLICYDGENVYAEDFSDNEKNFVLLYNTLDFIEANEDIFQRLNH